MPKPKRAALNGVRERRIEQEIVADAYPPHKHETGAANNLSPNGTAGVRGVRLD
jgi:hypothetical protein